jgi:ABC-type branched-subunit amino acid transport system substrate-binding protein
MAEFSIRKTFDTNPNVWLVAALSAATVVLVSAAIIGARKAESGAPPTGGAKSIANGYNTAPSESVVPGETAPVQAGDTGVTTPGGPTGGKGTAKAPAAAVKPPPGQQAVSAPGATRIGIFSDYFKFFIHGPVTVGGAPLNLAEDPVTGFKGYITYVNRQGGVNGRKIRMKLADDQYTTDGGSDAAKTMVQDQPFFAAGSLGIDQIAIAAKAARDNKIPYFAGGGPEPEAKNWQMYQSYINYDEDARIVAAFICKYGTAYVPGGEVRVGVSTLNSEWIRPVTERFVSQYLPQACGIQVDRAALVYIEKPTTQTNYTQQILQLRQSYAGKSANLIIPFQDPLTTSREVAEMSAQNYPPHKWNIMNFAHDSDTALTLMGKKWSGTGTQIMSPSCYYIAPTADDPSKCAAMGEAHRQWASLGQVTYDENVGGSYGSSSGSYNYTEDSWKTDGSGGSSGYQGVHFWLKSMRDIGIDPTREKFLSSLALYDRYTDLITGPITFRATSNTMKGATLFVLLEGGADDKWKQRVDITPGLVDHF